MAKQSFICCLFTYLIILVVSASDGLLQENHTQDFRYISLQDLLETADYFSKEKVTTFSRLLFDVSRDQMIVGARDTLYRMSFFLEPQETSTWEASPAMTKMCQDKGQSEEDCHNYIMVLQSFRNQLYVCGTNAFSPSCSWRQMENLTVTRYDKGVARCPFSPRANISTLMTENGEMFIGSTTDFSGSDPAILRVDVSSWGSRMIRTNQYNSKWLNDPQFVGSFEAGAFIYFVFRETAVEYINCGKIIYSRIARVCKNDNGGDHILKDNWTSFLKARLNCSLPGEYPFYFNEIQSMTYSSEEEILYAAFATAENSIHGSAVCAFNLSSINAAFLGSFKHQENINSAWESVNTPHRSHYECKSVQGSASYNHLLDSSRYQLMNMAVQPTNTYPLYVSKYERFTHIAIDITFIKFYGNVNVLFAATDSGIIKKVLLLPSTGQACIIEIWQMYPRSTGHILTMQYLKETESLYIGSKDSLLRIPAQRCYRHVSRTSCINAMDPYCGWNELLEKCTPPPKGDTSVKYWIQNITECPILTAPVDGGWSAWSDWSKCAQYDGQNIDSSASNVDACLCRTRTCNNPSPKNGGKECKGITIEVTNCTVNGGWTEWSAWSACSQTCGVAVKTRRRSCGNPKPAHGGRVCVGSDRAEIYCSHLPPCPVPKQSPIDGGWGPWGSWSECSSPCGGGFKIRRRKCNDPEPQNGGLDCAGCHMEYDVCNTHRCNEHKKVSSWTPWMTVANESAKADEYVEKRYRYVCKAVTFDASSLKISLAKEETRICRKNEICQRSFDNNEESTWSDWSPCSASCGGGQQYRLKLCDRPGCEGKTRIARACNTQPCNNWTCWTDWSPCSVSCGVGVRYRTRKCLSLDKNCEGNDTEEQLCEMPGCEASTGWSVWSEWSNCTFEDMQIRYRRCLPLLPGSLDCSGSDFEKRPCNQDFKADMIVSASMMWVTLVISSVISSLLSIIITYVIIKRRFSKTHVGNSSTSSTYDSYPNQYCSLPTKDNLEPRPKLKRQPSLNSGTSGNKTNSNIGGNLTKTNNVTSNNTPRALTHTYSEYEAGTLKKNSHGLNNHRVNRNLDDDKF